MYVHDPWEEFEFTNHWEENIIHIACIGTKGIILSVSACETETNPVPGKKKEYKEKLYS